MFQDFYTSKQSGRQLQWHNSLGTCLLRARFPKGAKELSVSLFQAVLLCLFNEADSYSLGARHLLERALCNGGGCGGSSGPPARSCWAGGCPAGGPEHHCQPTRPDPS